MIGRDILVWVLMNGMCGLWLSDTLWAAGDYPISEVAIQKVRLQDSFWQPRLKQDFDRTIPHLFTMLERGGYRTQLEVAAGMSDKKFPGGFVFFESDFYKSMDAVGEILKSYSSPDLERQMEEYGRLIALVQKPDGYLNWVRAARGKMNTEENEKFFLGALGNEYYEKTCNLSHELYCEGHFIEAAVSYYEATGKRGLLDIAVRIGNHLCEWFKEEKHRLPSDHQEIELALVRLYRATGDERYLAQARQFLDERGYYRNGRPNMGEYGQDHRSVVDQTEAVGHVVRGAYMYCGMLDMSAMTGDMRYAEAARKIWDDAVSRKMYITGGFGVPRDEGFPDPYDLPNRQAYCESCGGIGSMFWAHRLFRLYGDSKYYDVLERTLYNAFLASISLSGGAFNYNNPLESAGDHFRREWHGCACCPPNIARMLAQVPKYIYAVSEESIYVNLFIGSEGKLNLGDREVHIAQKTNYPWDGRIRLEVNPSMPSRFAVRIRVPGWSRGQAAPGGLYRFLDTVESRPTIMINGQEAKLELAKGYAVLDREWKQGDVVELILPMPIRRVIADERVKEDTGKVAIQRGPLVYCAEGSDNRGHVVDTLLKDNVVLSAHEDPRLGGVMIVEGRAERIKDGQSVVKPLEQIPYYSWNNRGLDEMAVFLARDSRAVNPSEPAFGYDFIALKNKTGWKLSTNISGSRTDIYRLADNDRRTEFTSAKAQDAGMYLQVELPEITKIDKIMMDSGQWSGDYARSYEVWISLDGMEWKKVQEGRGQSSIVRADVDGSQARYVRIQLGNQPVSNWWTIVEMDLCQNVTEGIE